MARQKRNGRSDISRVPDDIRQRKPTGEDSAIPLGRGIKDVQLLLLSTSRQLAGIGEFGELYVRSPHLADRLRGDDEHTNPRDFLINPFTKTQGSDV